MPARPPSERTQLAELTEKIEQLSKLLASLPQNPVSPNWWDVLPAGSEVLKGNYQQYWPIDIYGNDRWFGQCRLMLRRFEDKLELSIQINNQVIWERALFFERPRI